MNALLAMMCVVGALAQGVAVKDQAGALLEKPDAWFSSVEGMRAIDQIIAKQLSNGGWEKGYDIAPTAGPAPDEWTGVGTIDNGFTYTEIRVLAHAYKLTRRRNVLDSCDRAIDFLLKAQYENGGWPQRFPLIESYAHDITFNDDAMVRVMELMQDIVHDPAFDLVDAEHRAKAQIAFDHGMQCILRCQIIVGGVPTGWPQQCDPVTFAPTKARSYELPCISGNESAGVVLFLMRQEHPTPEMRRAIRSAAAWFEQSKVMGKRLEKRPDASLPKGYDVAIVDDPAAPPLWGRCYDLQTNQPFCCGRDGVKKWSLDQIEAERRSGYQWYGDWGKPVLEEFAKWSRTYGTSEVDRK
jgi:PelA/Pel-15E family pectate lyase